MAVFHCAVGFAIALAIFHRKKGLNKKILVASMTVGNSITFPYVLIPAITDSLDRYCN